MSTDASSPEGSRVEREVRRLDVLGEAYGECRHDQALLDAIKRYGLPGASVALSGCIDAPEKIPAGGVTAKWWPFSTWGGEEAGWLHINEVPRDA